MSTFQDLFETRFLGERVAMTFEQIPVAVTASLVGCGCIMTIYWASPSQTFVLAWGTAVVVSNLLRLFAFWSSRREGSAAISADHGHRQVIISSTIGGLMWGVAPVMLYPGALTVEFLFVVFVVGG